MSSEGDIGLALRRIRRARGKSLAVIAGRAGISVSHLSRLETGRRGLDSRSLVIALAEALEVAPSEITRTAAGASGVLEEDRWLGQVRLALLAVSMGEPEGRVVPVDVLRGRVTSVLDAQRRCEFGLVGARLPQLVRDLHATMDAGRDVRELLGLLVLTHVQGVQAWLSDIGASADLAWQAALLARQAAWRLDDPVMSGVAAFGVGWGLLFAGGLEHADAAVAAADPGSSTQVSMQVSGMLALTRALISATRRETAESSAALGYAAELAQRTGDGNAMWFGFGPANVGVWRMSAALEAGEYERTVRIAESVNPAVLSVTRQAAYYREYGRGLARMPRRRAAAVLMLRRAEKLSPARIHRHPFMRACVAELLAHAKRDAIGRELRGMAYRSGIPV